MAPGSFEMLQDTRILSLQINQNEIKLDKMLFIQPESSIKLA